MLKRGEKSIIAENRIEQITPEMPNDIVPNENELAILGIESATNQAVCGIFPPLGVDPRFLFRFFRTNTATTGRARKRWSTTVAERGNRLEYFTIVWNSLEGLVAVIAGALAGSISLVGFGIDSFVEVTSGATLLWRMSVDADAGSRERNERLSIRIVGVCFIALAVYVAYEAASDLVTAVISPLH